MSLVVRWGPQKPDRRGGGPDLQARFPKIDASIGNGRPIPPGVALLLLGCLLQSTEVVLGGAHESKVTHFLSNL